MGFFAWAGEHWFDLLSAIGIVGSLFFTAHSLRSETKTRKIANLLTITTNHREIWTEYLDRPELARILDASPNLVKKPVTEAETEFVNFVILHLASVFYAMKDELFINLEGVRLDAAKFLGLPIPKSIWAMTKRFQNHDFVVFVEDIMREGRNS